MCVCVCVRACMCVCVCCKYYSFTSQLHTWKPRSLYSYVIVLMCIEVQMHWQYSISLFYVAIASWLSIMNIVQLSWNTWVLPYQLLLDYCLSTWAIQLVPVCCVCITNCACVEERIVLKCAILNRTLWFASVLSNMSSRDDDFRLKLHHFLIMPTLENHHTISHLMILLRMIKNSHRLIMVTQKPKESQRMC